MLTHPLLLSKNLGYPVPTIPRFEPRFEAQQIWQRGALQFATVAEPILCNC